MTAKLVIAKGLKYISFAIVGIAIVAYLILFGRDGIEGAVFFFPFTMIPFIVSAYFVAKWPSFWSQIVLSLTIAGYAAWFGYVYVNATVTNPHSTSGIAFLFVSVYALPALAFLWLFTWLFQWESSR
jgi:hypothetical protein